MSQSAFSRLGRVGRGASIAALFLVGAASAHAQSAAGNQSNPGGRIDFAAANLPPATVEVDLTQGMFGDLFGLGDAAIAGIIESLAQSPAAQNNSQTAQMAAEKLAAARQVIQLAKDVVTEVRVRVYEDFPEASVESVTSGALFAPQLTQEPWDQAVRVKEKNNSVQVSFLRSDGAIRGMLVVVADGKNVVLANVVGDVSPENVKKLTASATKIGLEHGLLQELEKKMREMH